MRQAPGYYLATENLDLAEFSDHCVAARNAVADGRWHAAADATTAALGLWRGGLLTDLRDEPWVRDEAVRVGELHTECRENRVTALLALGSIAAALEDAAALRADEPLRERACWLHMLALYRAGRGPDALTAYTEHAAHLDAELGLRPGTELRDLQTAVLRQSPELAAWPRPPAWSGADAVVTPSSSTVEAPVPVGPQSLLVGRTARSPSSKGWSQKPSGAPRGGWYSPDRPESGRPVWPRRPRPPSRPRVGAWCG